MPTPAELGLAEAAAPLRVYIDLIGDLFNAGDLSLLRAARRLGDRLIVGLLSDDDAARVSHRPLMPLQERCALLAACRVVDEVVPAAPLVPDDAFLAHLAIDTVALVSDLGHAPRRDAFAALLDRGAGVVLAATEGPTTMALVHSVLARDWGPPSPAMRNRPGDADADADTAALVHAPPAGSGPEPTLALLLQGQRLVADMLAPLASAMLGQPWLMPPSTLTGDPWVRLLRVAARAQLDAQWPAVDDPLAVMLPLALLRRHWTPGRPLVLLGDHAAALACALGGEGPISVLQPGSSALPDLDLPAPGLTPPARPTVLTGSWPDMVWRCPAADLLACLDMRSAGVLLRSPRLLWHLSERLRDRLLIQVALSPRAEAAQEVSADDTTIHYADCSVRSALHRAGWFEVRDLVTAVGGLPQPPAAARSSRWCEQPALCHGDSFRYVDGQPARAVAVPDGTAPGSAILRWYVAAKGPLPPDALA